MKFLILFATSIDSPDGRIAAWIEHELPQRTVAIDINEMNRPEPLQHYVDWCDRVVLVGQLNSTIVDQIAHKPNLHLFDNGISGDTTIFFDEPETDHDRKLKAETLDRLRQFAGGN